MRRALALLTFFIATVAHGSEPGFYGGVGLSLVKYDVGLTDRIFFYSISPFGNAGVASVPAQSTSTDGDPVGWSAMLGYRFHRYFATELSYVSFGEVSATESFRAQGAVRNITATQDIEVGGPALSVLGTLPLNEHFELFLRGGMLFAKEKIQGHLLPSTSAVSKSDNALLAGIGTDVLLGSRWIVRFEYQITDALDEDVNADLGKIELRQFGVTGAFKF